MILLYLFSSDIFIFIMWSFFIVGMCASVCRCRWFFYKTIDLLNFTTRPVACIERGFQCMDVILTIWSQKPSCSLLVKGMWPKISLSQNTSDTYNESMLSLYHSYLLIYVEIGSSLLSQKKSVGGTLLLKKLTDWDETVSTFLLHRFCWSAETLQASLKELASLPGAFTEVTLAKDESLNQGGSRAGN